MMNKFAQVLDDCQELLAFYFKFNNDVLKTIQDQENEDSKEDGKEKEEEKKDESMSFNNPTAVYEFVNKVYNQLANLDE